MNLATEIAGVLITVLIVDYVFTRNQSAEWHGYKSRGYLRCRVLCNAIISTLRHAGRWSPSVITDSGPLDEEAIHRRLLAFASREITPAAPRLVANLSENDWRTIQQNFDGALREIEFIIQRFGQHFSPKQLESIDEVSRKLSGSMFFPTTFPEMFDSQHPRKDIRSEGIRQTSNALVELIQTVSAFSEELT